MADEEAKDRAPGWTTAAELVAKPIGEVEFAEDWKHWRGDQKPGRFAHWCLDWDFLPVDENCVEAQSCYDVQYDDEAKAAIRRAVARFDENDPFRDDF